MKQSLADASRNSKSFAIRSASLMAIALAAACGSVRAPAPNGTGGEMGAGGGGGSGGASGSGGRIGSGGSTGSGGSAGSGGLTGGGGAIGSGGRAGSGGGGSGGVSGSGGAGTGGAPGSGGAVGLCSTAFFSSSAAGLRAAEYQSWKAAHVQDCGNGSAVVKKDSGSVVSEGIGYGMLLAANNGDRALLDKLWKYYTDHTDKNGLMNWATGVCDPAGNNNANAASDGDLDAAMALLVADKTWGGYKSVAIGLIHKIKQFETDSCSNGLTVLRPGDVWGGCSDQNNMGKVNPSYFAPGYYRVFAQVDPGDATFWTKLAADSYTLLAQAQSAMNGLVPNWQNALTGAALDGTYGYDACRTPWRVAADYAWFCSAAAKTFLEKVSQYVDSKGGIATVPFDKNSAFLGAFADSGVATSQTKIDAYVSSWLGAQMDDTPYFQGTLRRLYLLVAGGQFSSGL